MEPKDMKILAFDSSTCVLTVACSDGRGHVSESNFEGALAHSENLFPLIESALRSLKLKFQEIDLYAMGVGPGSFTGLRIGFAVLKGFLIFHSKPVYGCSSLDLIAQGAALDSGRVGVLVNARRQRIYSAFYRTVNGILEKETAEDDLLSPEELIRRLDGPLVVTGDAIQAYSADIQKRQSKAVLLGKKFWYPHASHLVRMVEDRSKNVQLLSRASMNPRYLRLSEAEEKRIGNVLST